MILSDVLYEARYGLAINLRARGWDVGRMSCDSQDKFSSLSLDIPNDGQQSLQLCRRG